MAPDGCSPIVATEANGNTNTCSFTVQVNNTRPTVTLIAPTNQSSFVLPQNIALLAEATDSDGWVTQVVFYAEEHQLGTITNTPTVFIWTNATPGLHQLLAVATDNQGATSTSPVVNVTVLNQAPSAASLAETNTLRVRQTGLFYQTVRISNPTPWSFGTVRLTLSNLPPVVRVWNATGTNHGLPFIESQQPVPPGSNVDVTIEYYVSDRRTIPNPVFIVELISPTPSPAATLAHWSITRTQPLPDGTVLVEFATRADRTCYVLYSSDLLNWNVASPPIPGTGATAQWIDRGPPGTKSSPRSATQRHYRLIELP